ncbi:MAG: diguanylate cyclase [Acidobacteria bacterium]|nr:diguanylate cyclase [Acidobacteriota bacterium]
MSNPLNFYVIYLIFAIIVSTFINLYAWRNPQTRGSRAFMAASVISITWLLGDVVCRLSTTMAGKWAGEEIRYLGIVLLPVSLLVFTFQYCGKHIGRRKLALLLVVPCATWLTMVTNSWHQLFFRSIEFRFDDLPKVEYGPYFWFVHLPYCYGVMLTVLGTILMEFSRASRNYRKQILLLFVSFSIPLVVNVIGVFKLFGDVSYTPLSIPIFFSVVAYAVFRYQFLGSNPIGYEAVFQTIRDGVLILDQRDVIRDINPAAAKGLAKDPVEVIGLHVREAFGPWPSAIELYEKNPRTLGEIEVTLFGKTRFLAIDSTPMHNRGGHLKGRIITIRDITDRYQYLLSLESLAFHDPLTRVANRRKFQEEVERAIEKAQETGDGFALLYIDLNRFKAVNDTLGHETGDELLKYVAARLASVLRKPDTVARLGGDEFGLLLNKCDAHGVEIVVERLLDNVQRPFQVGAHTLVADLSIGAAFYPEDGKNLTELLRVADVAMYRAKQNGGGLALLTTKIEEVVRMPM